MLYIYFPAALFPFFPLLFAWLGYLSIKKPARRDRWALGFGAFGTLGLVALAPMEGGGWVGPGLLMLPIAVAGTLICLLKPPYRDKGAAGILCRVFSLLAAVAATYFVYLKEVPL